MRTPVRIAVTRRGGGWKEVCPSAARLARKAARAALAGALPPDPPAPPGGIELSLVLTGDAEQRRLNHRYRGRDAPTNVLSFPAAPQAGPAAPPELPLLLGDVVIACETLAREAAEQRKPVCDHLRHLVVHGVLHLLGYDHEMEREARHMETLETAILGRLGVPDPYGEVT